MKIEAKWNPPQKLNKVNNNIAIYNVKIDKVPEEPGCYVFYNKYGKSIKILYIGQTLNLNSRIESQLNNLRLMKGLENSIKGNKFIIYCTIKLKSGQRLKNVLNVLERNLIKAALADGHELLNRNLTKVSYSEILITPNSDSRKMFKSKMVTPLK